MTDQPKVNANDLRGRLSEEQYQITQQCGTEPPFTGIYWDSKDDGIYRCIVCETALFDANTKYDSGTGWPSFYTPIAPDVIRETEDISLGMRRIEATCANCGAHLGHVFPDGPKPTGLRYCINSASLNLDPVKQR